MDTLSEMLKALADPNRLRIMHLLGRQTLCVCDLEAVLGLEQSNLSRHLLRLRQAGLVRAQKDGQFVYCSRRIPSPNEAWLEALYRTIDQNPDWEMDRQALAIRQCQC
jgi:DNA-binding transcriptional ArsR family regulator